MKFSIITGFTDEKNTRLTTTLLPSPLPRRVCRHHAHMLKTHVRVVPAYTGFSACHTPHAPHTTPQPHHNHTTRRQTQRERQRERRGDEREEDKRIEERREKILFQCGGAWPFFVGVVIFSLIPFARETLAC